MASLSRNRGGRTHSAATRLMGEDPAEAPKPKRRRNSSNACTQCRKRHLCCDGCPCSRCVRLGLQCELVKQQKRGPKIRLQGGRVERERTPAGHTFTSTTAKGLPTIVLQVKEECVGQQRSEEGAERGSTSTPSSSDGGGEGRAQTVGESCALPPHPQQLRVVEDDLLGVAESEEQDLLVEKVWYSRKEWESFLLSAPSFFSEEDFPPPAFFQVVTQEGLSVVHPYTSGAMATTPTSTVSSDSSYSSYSVEEPSPQQWALPESLTWSSHGGTTTFPEDFFSKSSTMSGAPSCVDLTNLYPTLSPIPCEEIDPLGRDAQGFICSHHPIL